MYANIIPLTTIPRDRKQIFTYQIPRELHGKLFRGSVVEIDFAHRNLRGVVVKIHKKGKKSIPYKLVNSAHHSSFFINKHQYKLAQWISAYYFSPLSLVLKSFIPTWYGKMTLEISRDLYKQKKKKYLKPNKKTIVFTKDQSQSWKAIDHSLSEQESHSFLLHGVTGSGKTEIYIRTFEKALASGKQALFMVPEIALTTQFIQKFTTRFDADHVVVLHSKIPARERMNIFLKIAQNKAKIIIGPRSALFAPFTQLGVIVIDEEHDSSYKQYDQNPRYHSRLVAEQLSKIWKCPLVLGSATPSVETYYHATRGDMTLLRLPDRYLESSDDKTSPMPRVKIVDMREEFKKGNHSTLSECLIHKLSQILHEKEQAMLFINRRGMSTFVMCRDCGDILNCNNCDIPYVYHAIRGGKTQHLYCHHCGSISPVPLVCPTCKSRAIKYFGAGTQRVEHDIKKLFPRVTYTRMDSDTTQKIGSHKRLINQFISQQSDILIGTQMISKGFDLPNVSLVGIISVDNILHLPDFHGYENVFQLLTQVSGRAGRRKSRGQAIIQTYSPENPVFTYALTHDYYSFYQHEIQDRKALGYPPFSRLIKLEFSHENKEYAKNHACKLKSKIDTYFIKNKTTFRGEIIGPSPSFLPKRRKKYFWHIIIKHHESQERLSELLRLIPHAWSIDIDPQSLL